MLRPATCISWGILKRGTPPNRTNRTTSSHDYSHTTDIGPVPVHQLQVLVTKLLGFKHIMSLHCFSKVQKVEQYRTTNNKEATSSSLNMSTKNFIISPPPATSATHLPF